MTLAGKAAGTRNLVFRLIGLSLAWMFLFCYILTSVSSSNLRSESLKSKYARELLKSDNISPETTLECLRREYKYRAVQTDHLGRKCWQYISVISCWGRCDSGEIGHYEFPHKLSFHPVCLPSDVRLRRIKLKHCDEGAPLDLKYYEYLEATNCVCRKCPSANTSCEAVPFMGTLPP